MKERFKFELLTWCWVEFLLCGFALGVGFACLVFVASYVLSP